MNEPFVIPVFYQGTEHEFKARFERWGDNHRISVLVDDITVSFEPNEEGGYRAISSPELNKSGISSSGPLLQAIVEKLVIMGR